MELDASDLKRGLKFIVGTWTVDYLVNAWSNDLKHIPASEFKSEDGNDFSAVTYTFFEDHTLLMKNAANGQEEQGTWEQTGWGTFHYTLNGFLNLPNSDFLKAAETLEMRDGEYLVFALGFYAVALKKTEEGTVTEEPGIGDTEMSEEDLTMTEIAGKYEVAKAMAMIGDEFSLFSKEEVIRDLDRRIASGEIDEDEKREMMQLFDVIVEFTPDHRVLQWMKIPEGVSEEEIRAAVEACEIGPIENGYFTRDEKAWKALDGKYYYDTGEHREMFGEEQSSWDELKTDEEGLLEFGSGMMKLRKM
ncbi:MAG: hypothetical protein J6Y95_07105 [Lachnospiraceae bacterium]|nr:hypothetical protein [Lachnospiraceae bacterium]